MFFSKSRAFKVSPFEVNPFKVGIGESRASEVRPDEVGIGEAYPLSNSIT